ncbi:probable disease resistance protein At5g66900 isoform X2 [Mangifera indica]|uniref:probable disease resistance protein At5g66900 isoform X2 n=1 Tax=Mangifera indica TaxID=29780 RepID=UPI001CFA4FDB|nr:probable disease resistance protein At5g66900 isoform X2 [Mangifera indica]
MEFPLIGVAFPGTVFGELLRAVVEPKGKAKHFKPQLEQLESTLRNNAKVIEQIEKYNEILDHPRSETQLLKEKMQEGVLLVRRCSTVKWNPIKKTRYADRLVKLNSLINRFFQVDMQAQQTRDTKEILLGMRDLQRSFIASSSTGDISGKLDQDGIIRPCSVPDPPEITPGLDVPLEELKRELLRDGEQVIVVSAPGGTGKTTLIKKLCKDQKVEEKFKDNIFFVTVSKPHNVKVIVQKIIQHLGKDVPEFQTDEHAINDLERLLKEMGSQPILLVLDDVWSESESMLRKFKSQLPNYKILVTSRSVFPKLGFVYKLKPLYEEAAETLFRYTTGGDSSIRDQKLVNKILGICKGSPLALTVIGRSLCGRPAAVWKSKVKEWQHATIFHSNTDLLVCLQSSLDALDDKLKECYMDLGSFPEYHRIPVATLIDMWVELYKRDEDDLCAILSDLSNVNLFDLVVTSDESSHHYHFVEQHDLLRELIIYQSMLEPVEKMKRLFIEISGNNFPEWWLEKKSQPVNARLLSITTDDTFSSSWYDLEAPAVEVVVLNVRTKEYTMPNFMEKMKNLKVLIVTGCGFLPVEISNFQLLGSLPNLKRIRLEQVSIPWFDMTTMQMRHLQKISLVLCNVGQVFSNSTFQISNAFPNLKELDIDYCNDLEALPDDMGNIVSLKTLSITNCHKLPQLPDGIGKLVNLEVLKLASCSDLEALPGSIENLINLKFLDISECLSTAELPVQIGRSLEERQRDGFIDNDRDRSNGAGDGVSSTIKSVCSHCVERKKTGYLETRPTRKLQLDLNTIESSREKMFQHYYNFPQGNKVWSATEMLCLDVPGLPLSGYFDYTAFSADNSPCQGPPSLSPCRNPVSPTGTPSPVNSKLSHETASHVEVHPLPLPPGSPISSLPTSIPHILAKPEPCPMNNQWKKGKLIGRGTFGSVYVASNRETGALCAMKEVEIFPDDPKSAECIKQLEQEIKVLSQLKHPNIVQYYGSEIVEDKFYIYMEYVHPGSINKYVREHCGAMTESVVRNFTRHILSGLAYLHSKKTIHRDIKGANLLVDALGVVKLADFGMAKLLTGQGADLSFKGSPYWMAPELIMSLMQKDSNSDLALAVDIWSLGCTIIEMFTGKPPWSEFEGVLMVSCSRDCFRGLQYQGVSVMVACIDAGCSYF